MQYYLLIKFLIIYLLAFAFLFVINTMVQFLPIRNQILTSSVVSACVSLYLLHLFLHKKNLYVLIDNLSIARYKIFFNASLSALIINVTLILMTK